MATIDTPKFFLVTGINSGASPVALMLHQLGVYMGKNFFKLPGSEESSCEDYRIRMLLKKFYTPLIDNETLEDSYRRSFKIAFYNCIGKLIEEKSETWRSGSNQNFFKYAGLKIPPFAEIVKVASELINGDVLLVNCIRNREETLASLKNHKPESSEEELVTKLDLLEKRRIEMLSLFDSSKVLTLDYNNIINATKLAAYRIIKFGDLDTKYTDVRNSVQHIYNYRDDIFVETEEEANDAGDEVEQLSIQTGDAATLGEVLPTDRPTSSADLSSALKKN